MGGPTGLHAVTGKLLRMEKNLREKLPFLKIKLLRLHMVL